MGDSRDHVNHAMMVREFASGRNLIGRLQTGDDLYQGLLAVCCGRSVSMGWLSAIGALSAAKFAYYNQQSRQYEQREVLGDYEILSVMGNISRKEGKSIIHAHITMGDDHGRAFGGHLLPGCIVFACEFMISELCGEPLVREYEATTGLPLWGNW